MSPPDRPLSHPAGRAATGIAGLDDVLGGGLIRNRLYLVEGTPGTGKTTLALQFLLDGAARGEAGLYVTLSETAEELGVVAESHGWSLDAISLFELVTAESGLAPDQELTLLHPWEMELGETTKRIFAEVEETKAERVVFDSLSELRLLAQAPLRYRRQILALKQFFAGRHCTVLLPDDKTAEGHDLQLHSIAHGVITLEQRALAFGAEHRKLRVLKMRGAQYRGGYHDFVIRPGGLVVFPQLVAAEHHAAFAGDSVPSGVAELDALLDGGPLRGTTTLVLGPAGSGKSTIALQYVLAAAERGERSAFYAFDERLGTLLARSAKLGMDLRPPLEAGLVAVEQVDPAELSPGEFTQKVRHQVEVNGARVLVIDSLNGYLNAMPEQQALLLQLRELLSYLNQRGLATLLIMVQHGLIGKMVSSADVSYLSDAVLLLRFFETDGRIRKALSVLKNRGGAHEETIREMRFGPGGLLVGQPLICFRGILTGTPVYVGTNGSLLGTGDNGER